MGKRIENRVRGVGWMKKINLITATTLIASLVIYGGLYSPYQSMALTQSWTTAGSGSWTIPANVYSITVETWGGGGGGGGIAGSTTKNTTASGGGGGGSYASVTKAVTPGQTYYYTVGSGGAGGAAGNNVGIAGGNSVFKDTNNTTILVQGNGGSGGGGAAVNGAGAAGAAGTLGTGTVRNTGGAGAAGNATNSGYGGGGGGGAAYGGAGGTATSGTGGTGGTIGTGSSAGGAGATSNGSTAVSGAAPGGGGAGVYVRNSTVAAGFAGGAGGVGRITITYTPATAPVVAAAATISSIGSVSATLGGSITGNGGAPMTDYGIVWSSTNSNPTVGGAGVTKVQKGATDFTGAFTSSVTGLPQAVRIYFAAYATNSVGTAYSTVYSFYTEPSTQASNVSITGITGTQMTVNWTNGSGDGALVLMKAASAVTGVPTDGTYSYTASTTFGSGTLISDGYTVYKGTGTSVTVTGLTSGTTYYVAVFASAGASTTSGVNIGTNYVNTTPATASATAQNSTPVIGTVSVTPTVGSYTNQAPTVSASVSLASGTPSSCEYTVDNGSNWIVGTLTGSSSPWTCTASPTGLSGTKQFNIRATSLGFTGTGTAATLTVDIDLPIISTQSPADGANLVLEGLTLTGSATDASSGIDQYRIIIYNSGHVQVSDTGWTTTTGSISYAPVGLSYSSTYYWALSVKDKVGNITNADERIFSTKGACIRNDPTVTLSTPGDTVSAKILVDAGSALYRLRVRNNDVGGCSDSLFTLTGANTFKAVTQEYPQDDTPKFNSPPTLGSPNVTVAAGSYQDINVTVTATTASGADVSGVAYTTVTAANAQHASVVSNQVLTVLNVAGCSKNAPLLTIGPDVAYSARGGSAVYTVSVKNNDAGANCAAYDFNLTKISDSNAKFTSALSQTVLNLKPGQAKTAYLTVTSASDVTNTTANVTTVGVSEAGHPVAANKIATTTIGDTMIHNSDNLNSTKWGAGGWGVPGGRYGEIVCNTCHVPGGSDTANIKRIREAIYTPYTGAHQHFPGEGRTLGLRKIMPNDTALPNATDPSFGWDATANKLTNPVKICEVCHTYDPAGTNGTKFHGQTGTALPSHYDGRDCLKCHKHNAGFGLAGMNCNFCHGDSSVQTQPTAANRYVVAPPLNAAGVTGTITGIGLVSNDPKVGAHQTHVRYLNGFSNYSTYDYRCEGCHGTLPTNTSHMNGSSPMAFQGLAVRGGMSPTFNGTNLTCTNTYCHNPAGTGGTLAAANAGSAIFPSWTSASYISDGGKTDANCNKCHKSPGAVGFSYQGSHSQSTVVGYDCSGCHGHNGDSSGPVGKRHMDGIRSADGNCNSCHAYDTNGSNWLPNLSGGSGAGVHAVHINFIKSRLSIATLTPTGQTFGTGEPKGVCGTCHTNTNTPAEHTTTGGGVRNINFGDSSYTMGSGYGASMSLLFGSNGSPTFSGAAKSCSNLACHYYTTPSWY